MLRCLSFIFLLILLARVTGWSQDASPATVKAAMTAKFMEYVDWPEGTASDGYRIGALTGKKEIYDDFSRVFRVSKVQKKKILSVEHFKDPSAVKDVQALFIDAAFSTHLNDIIRSLPPHILVVSDEASDKQSVMINLFREEGRLKFEINKANVINAGLSASPTLILLGGTDLDVAALYKDARQDLEKEKEKVKAQRLELEQMRSEALAKKQEIDSLYAETASQREEIKARNVAIEQQKRQMTDLDREAALKQKLLDEHDRTLQEQEKTIAAKEDVTRKQQEEIERRLAELRELEQEIADQKAVLSVQQDKIQLQENLIYFSIAIIALVLSTAFLAYGNYRSQKKFNERLADKNAKIESQREELQAQTENLHTANQEIKAQNLKLRSLYHEIQDSIRAARTLQQSMLPSQELIKRELPEFFVLNIPKDIVGGDFYWFGVKDERIIMAAIDCTGHGVSGAFMSLLSHLALNECVHSCKTLRAADILDRLNDRVIRELNRENDESLFTDGMDISLFIFDKKKRRLQFAGAKNSLYILRDQKIIEIKGDSFSIGMILAKNKKYTNHTVALAKDDIIYAFSDGYADQIGGEKGDEKFLYYRFRNLLSQIGDKPMAEQLSHLDETFRQWKGDHEQLDDILVMGVKI